MHAWLSRGLSLAEARSYESFSQHKSTQSCCHPCHPHFTQVAQDLIKWRFDGDVAQFNKVMKSCKNSMADLFRLEDIRQTDNAEDARLEDEAKNTLLQGEKISTWAIVNKDNPDLGPIKLPAWFRQPIERTILLWQRECDAWQHKLMQRRDSGHTKLSNAQQQKFDEWVQQIRRRIILDKTRKCQVWNIDSKKIQSLRRNCLLLEINMSSDPTELEIRSGLGEFWQLKLLQGILPADNVPAEIDEQPGWKYQPSPVLQIAP